MTMKMKRFYSLPPSLIFISPLIQDLVTVEVREVVEATAVVEEDNDKVLGGVGSLFVISPSVVVVTQRTFLRHY